MPEAMVYQIQ